MKKLISILLSFILLFNFFSVSCFAADDSNFINTLDLGYQGFLSTSSGVFDVTDDITVTPITGTSSVFHTFIRYLFPYDSSSAVRLYASFMLFDDYSLNSNHEYNLNFKWGYNANLPCNIQVAIVYNGVNGNILKEQILFEQQGSGKNIIHSIDTDFKPDLSNISGSYNSVLQIRFLQDGLDSPSTGQAFYISSEINLVDKDDDSGWFQKIINKIEDTINNIKQVPEKINLKLNELKQSIVNAFVELKDNILDGLKNLFIPSDDYFDNLIEDLKSYFEQKFGVLMLPFSIMELFVDLYSNLSTGSGVLEWPDFVFNDVVIIKHGYFSLGAMIQEFLDNFGAFSGDVYPNLYYIATDVIMILGFVHFCRKKYNSITTGVET